MKRTAWKAILAGILMLVLAVGLGPGVFAEEDVIFLDPPEPTSDPTEDEPATLPSDTATEEETTEPETEEETTEPEEPDKPEKVVVQEKPKNLASVPPVTLAGPVATPTEISGLNPAYDYEVSSDPGPKEIKSTTIGGTNDNLGTLNKDMFVTSPVTELVPKDIIDYISASSPKVVLDVHVTATDPTTVTKPTFTAVLDENALTYDLKIPEGIAVGIYSLDIGLTTTGSLTEPILIQKVVLTVPGYIGGFVSATPEPEGNKEKYDLAYGTYSYDIPLQTSMFTRVPTNEQVSLSKLRNAFSLTAASTVSAFSATFESGGTYPVIRVKADSTKIKTDTPYAVTVTATYKDTTNVAGAIPNATFPTQTITFLPEKTTGTEITGFASGSELGYDGSFVYLNGDSAALSKSEAGELELEVGDYVDIMFTPKFFSWGDGATPPPRNYITEGEADDANLSLVNPSGTGYTYADAELIFDDDKSYIRVTFDGLTGTVSKPVDITAGLKLGSASSTTTNTRRVTLKGDLDFKMTKVYDDEEHVELSEGEIVIAPDELLRNVELALDYNITIVTDLMKNRRTWVTVTEGELTAADERMIDKYWEIEYVYTLKSSGLSSTRTTVYFDDWYQNTAASPSLLELKPTPLGEIDDAFGELLRTPMRMARDRLRIQNVSRYSDDRRYVYRPASTAAQTLVYLGTTDRGVEFSTKYYLSSERIEGVSSATSSSRSSSSSGAYVPPSSGSSSALTPSIGNPSGATPGGVFPANPNFNPNNGW